MTQKYYYLFAGLALIGVLAWVLTTSNPTIRRAAAPRAMVTVTSPEAFGSFTAGSLAGRSSALQTTAPTSSLSGAADAQQSPEKNSIVNNAVRFTYSGPTVTLPSFPVLRRDVARDPFTVQQLGAGISGTLNLSSFTRARIDSLALTEAGDNGFSIWVDLQHGVSSLYRNIGGPERKVAVAPAIPTSTPAVTQEAAIHLAQDFIQAHGISVAGTGAPVVLSTSIAAKAVDLLLAPANEMVTVVFPWHINDIPVVDQSGNPYGLSVTVDTVSGEVTGAYNISTLQFTGSTYPMLTDTAKALAIAEQGGQFGVYDGSASNTSTVPLLAPTPVYMVSSYQLSTDGTDYLVPALRFPIGVVPATVTLYQQFVMVPLVASLYETPSVSPASGSTTPSSGTGSSAAGSSLAPSMANDQPTSAR